MSRVWTGRAVPRVDSYPAWSRSAGYRTSISLPPRECKSGAGPEPWSPSSAPVPRSSEYAYSKTFGRGPDSRGSGIEQEEEGGKGE